VKGSDPRFLINMNGRVMFTAYEDHTGTELYTSLGDDASTNLVLDIRPGPDSSFPNNFVVFNGRVYFQANDGRCVLALSGLLAVSLRL
jgi:ELWxxDGT repeat protein